MQSETGQDLPWVKNDELLGTWGQVRVIAFLARLAMERIQRAVWWRRVENILHCNKAEQFRALVVAQSRVSPPPKVDSLAELAKVSCAAAHLAHGEVVLDDASSIGLLGSMEA